MIGIGSFAQLAKVSVRTLRHYDDVGLLRPVSVDSSTGYRSYAAAQLPQLNRILALKDLGFSLAEITRMVESGVSRDELLGMLKLRQAEAQRAAADERKRLARVAARIDSLTGELTMNTTNTNLDALDTAVVIKRSTEYVWRSPLRRRPPVERAATLIHIGAMTGVSDSFDTLVRWIDQASEEAVGFGREVYLECPDDDYDAWVTELQFVLR